MHVFGPVPSRRLGRSLGINNIPPKYCSYACVYCQLGRALSLTSTPATFYSPAKLVDEVTCVLERLRNVGEEIDYLTLVADGEPTLDNHLDELLSRLRHFNIPIAVITNATLLHLPEVRKALLSADWVSVKVDSVTEEVWRRIDRPAKNMILETILAGIELFAANFKGELVTETMLVDGINTSAKELEKTSVYIGKLNPDCAYLSAPVRPPAEEWIEIPEAAVLNRAYQLFSHSLKHVEFLLGYEGNAFANTGDPLEDILSITAVHPMREDALKEFLGRQGVGFDCVHKLVQQNLLKCSTYAGRRFYVRALRRN